LERLRLEDLAEYRFLSGIAYNNTGELACFAVHKGNVEENNYTSVLWVYDQPRDKLYQLTALGEERSFSWMDDGEHVLFSGKRGQKDKEGAERGREETIFYKINVHGGEAQEAFRIPLRVRRLYELNPDKFLVLGTINLGRPPAYTLSSEERKAQEEQAAEERYCEVLEEIPYWANGGGFISLNRTHVFQYIASTGQLTDLTPGPIDIDLVTLSADKTKALCVGAEFQGKGPVSNSLYVLDLEAGTCTQVAGDEGFRYTYAHFLDEGKALAAGSGMQAYGLNENPKFYRVDLATGEQELLTEDWDQSLWNSVNSDCRYGGSDAFRFHEGWLYFASTRGNDAHLYRIAGDGRVEQLTQEPGSVDGFAVHGDRVLIIALRGSKLQEIYRLEGGEETQVTEFNAWVGKERCLAQLEPVVVETAPGVAIDGWVMRPVGFVEGERYPGILNIHGGPKTAYGTVFVHEMQYWANQGYFVFFCNPRGSDGKGNAFADIRGKYGTIDYKDLMAFTDEVLRRYPAIDPSRLGVTGGSYGGFMTNWIIGHTTRFRAAASQRSISNWVSMGWTTDIGYYFTPDQIGATPWSDLEKLWEHSPLKYADKAKTPTLFIHSDEDYRCWLPEALQMFAALRYHGVEARLCMFRGENHELSRSGKPKHRIRRLREITQWFDKHLKEA
jgi:dipeptidyl aminopeptidase/acylaminoacyl peptidase